MSMQTIPSVMFNFWRYRNITIILDGFLAVVRVENPVLCFPFC